MTTPNSISEQSVATIPEQYAFIDGLDTPSASGKTLPVYSPINDQNLTSIAACDANDVDKAVTAARRAFDDQRWAGQSPSQRKTVLLRLATLIEEHAEELAILETRDVGMHYMIADKKCVPDAVRCFRWYAEALDKIYDEIAPTGPDAFAWVRRFPVGVVGAILPWNAPLMIAAWKLAPALAAGNSVIVIPSDQAPLSILRLAHLAAEAGIPDGVLNIVTGSGPVVGEALCLHNDVNTVVFTGSTRVGKQLLRYSAESNMKRIQLECGGKSANIVFADCGNLEAAAQAVTMDIFRHQGQVCTAGSRLLIEQPIYEELLGLVVDQAKQLPIGNPFDMNVALGPVINATHAENICSYIGLGKQEGAKINLEGGPTLESVGGAYVKPTVISDVKPTMRIAQEEIFGPILCVAPFSEVNEAIKIANSTVYGLAGSVWTKDIDKAFYVYDRIEAGNISINTTGASDVIVPFGGLKQSGLGSDKSLRAFENYTNLKTGWLARSVPQ